MLTKLKLITKVIFSNDKISILIKLLYEVGRAILVQKILPVLLEFKTKSQKKVSSVTVSQITSLAKQIYYEVAELNEDTMKNGLTLCKPYREGKKNYKEFNEKE